MQPTYVAGQASSKCTPWCAVIRIHTLFVPFTLCCISAFSSLATIPQYGWYDTGPTYKAYREWRGHNTSCQAYEYHYNSFERAGSNHCCAKSYSIDHTVTVLSSVAKACTNWCHEVVYFCFKKGWHISFVFHYLHMYTVQVHLHLAVCYRLQFLMDSSLWPSD